MGRRSRAVGGTLASIEPFPVLSIDTDTSPG